MNYIIFYFTTILLKSDKFTCSFTVTVHFCQYYIVRQLF